MIIKQIFGPLVPAQTIKNQTSKKEKKCSKESDNFDMCIISKKPVEICKEILKTYHKCLDKEIKDK